MPDDIEMDFENRIVAPEYTPEDMDTENPLRPKTLEDYIGQKKAKENLSVYIEAARGRQEALDHVLLARPWQDHPGRHHRQRNEGASAGDLRPRH